MTDAERKAFYLAHRRYRSQRVARMADIFGVQALEELFSIVVKSPEAVNPVAVASELITTTQPTPAPHV